MITCVALHPGTGTEIVTGILQGLGVKSEIVQTREAVMNIKFDGVILLGGSDINPFYYGEGIRYAYHINRERDYIEWILARRAMTKHFPIFGICRGMQMITVAHGGSLYQDIYRQKVTGDHPNQHRITIDGALARYAASDLVNSLHHQALKTLPDGFKVLARAEDGITEAIYKPGVLGVQWHPELLYQNDRRWQALFKWFANGLY